MNRHDYLTGGAASLAKRGIELPQSKLNPEIVRMIRRSDKTSKKLAEELCVHKRTIDGVRSGRTWHSVR